MAFPKNSDHKSDTPWGYHTLKPALLLKEYGRNVQNMVEHLKTLPDRQERTQAAYALINVLKEVNPTLKEVNDNEQRIWDHLYLMAGFDLDIDSPFPPPSPDTLHQKPKHLGYQKTEFRFRHYGRNVENLLIDAIALPDRSDRLAAYAYIGKLMRQLYTTWNKDQVEDATLFNDMKRILGSKSEKLDLDIDTIKEMSLFQVGNYSDANLENSYTIFVPEKAPTKKKKVRPALKRKRLS
ncbi:DUF4290 domain-containing protein [Hugenholtzia roseola]|uniref:DUF4290 domain-containing protein n=1 Tax=Hugenholtzia roseola TaxID=1002 RepID=UPI0013768384|nr:DUF4290 domain-containing protein [Hugenholtzia roseola]